VAAAPAAAPILKVDSAYAELCKIADNLCGEDATLSRHAAFAKAYLAHPELAARAKTESAFA
jgi:hypothetical protein